MDLSERRAGSAARHPWETARAEAIASLMTALPLHAPRVLDIGCGDGYLVGQLVERLPLGPVTAIDTHLTEELCAELAQPGVRFATRLDPECREPADLILLLDVLEHVESPTEFLTREVIPQLADSGYVIVTVPAFQSLYSGHDRQLRHFRRYNLADIRRVATAAGLEVLESGYLFSSLLVPRAISTLAERFVRPRVAATTGVGDWRGAPALTRLVHQALCLDNRLCLSASRWGVTLPGLSAWLTCRRPS